ncbi:MAG: 2-oxoacid:acceptor oxidoreductase subunit alpha [Actinobacteria bacterium]|nr:MAG: 2-oxoacid:acceptor oxidoreductase subunit alpha [Actinomycetota bacterium]
MAKPVQELDRVIIRFAGDSGDGMQLTGGRFTSETAVLGNDLSTLPDFPAEIRAPAGSLPGVSGFQVHFADHDILTPGDAPNVLVAMNPAALKTNIRDLPKGGTLIVNSDSFTARNLEKAGYETNPLEDGSLDEFQVHSVQLTSMTLEALKDVDVTKREAERAKNMFALGLMSWLYNRPTEGTVEFIERKFASKPSIAEANRRAFQAGYAFGETTESFAVSYEVKPAKLRPGVYRNVTGNQALSLGLVAASVQSKLPLFLGAYPITPASGILEELARFKNFGVRTFQAEDEIAAVGAALGASFGGSLGVSTSSGPGVVLKGETIGLAVALELPLVILDIQRAGPSTGMPTKPEQADLLLALYGRNAESPVPVVAASTPGNCFDAALEAVRIATKYRTPVFLLSDAYLANGSEPWLIPDVASLPDLSVEFASEPNQDGKFMPYLRDERTLARPWAIPGTPGLEHRIGGLEKEAVTGNVSYDPDNHDYMVRVRARKVAGIAGDIPDLEVDDEEGARLLVLGWGGTAGPIGAAVRRVREGGRKVAAAHLHHLNPFPRNTGDVLRRYDRVLVPEMNLGQLLKVVRAEFLVDAVGYNRVRGLPFTSAELAEAIEAMA